MARAESAPPSVAITIVTYNSARFIEQCLAHVFALRYPNFEVVVVDNASVDDTASILALHTGRVRVVLNRENTGFSRGQNQAMALSRSDWVLTLNPDVRLTPDFLTKAVQAGESDSEIGMVSGKLLAMRPDFSIPSEPEFDSTGVFMTPNLRHFDRGSRERDRGQYEQEEYVFGVTGAAALYLRRMTEDIACAGEFFDGDFFAYREDVDVAWRAQWRGWRCLYTPHAVAYHVRSVLPSERRAVSALINMHSVKNRFLMRIKNTPRALYKRHGAAILWRDVVVFGGCLLQEFRSLKAFWLVLRYWRRTWQKRREIMQGRRVSDDYIVSWFSNDPVSFPLSRVAERYEPE